MLKPQRNTARDKPTVAIVDEDLYFLQPLILELELRGCVVKRFNNPKRLLKYLKMHEPDLLITDVMMPHGPEFDEFETQGGFLTGKVLAEEVRAVRPELKIIAFSNHLDAHVSEWFENQDDMWFYSKKDFSDVALFSEHIARILVGDDDLAPALAKKFFDSLEMKPGIFGLSVDLKELWKAVREVLRQRR